MNRLLFAFLELRRALKLEPRWVEKSWGAADFIRDLPEKLRRMHRGMFDPGGFQGDSYGFDPSAGDG